ADSMEIRASTDIWLSLIPVPTTVRDPFRMRFPKGGNPLPSSDFLCAFAPLREILSDASRKAQRRKGQPLKQSRTLNGRNQPVDFARRNIERLLFGDESANQLWVFAQERRLVLLRKAGELHGPSRISPEGARFSRTRVHPDEVVDQRHVKSSQSCVMRVVR